MLFSKDEIRRAAHDLAMEYVRQNPPVPNNDVIDVEPYVNLYTVAYREVIHLLEKEAAHGN